MARKPAKAARNEPVLVDVLYEDGARSSNRKVPAELFDSAEGDDAVRAFLEAQDRDIAELSGRPRGPIKSVSRAAGRR